ncbi:MAG: NADH-quinone oxidoreductase subunit J [Acidobacteria bacterium]|nr:NADH-quinone oxidoreductase subunit J [Acidobacteriota bacterium]
MEKYLFWVMAVTALLSGLGMVMARNAVHSALMLVVNFFALAVFYVLLGAHFLAAVQIIVYAGAIMVLFLFVIMLMGVQREEPADEPIRFQRPLALLAGGALGGLLVFVIRTSFGLARFAEQAGSSSAGNAQGIGRALFTSYLFPFEVTSILLIVAAIGVVVIGRREPESEEPAAPAPASSEPGGGP